MQHTNHRKHAPAFRQHFQTTRQVFRRVGIMGDIKDNARRLTHDLKTSRQGSLRNTVANRLLVNVQPAGAQRGQGGGGIRLGTCGNDSPASVPSPSVNAQWVAVTS